MADIVSNTVRSRMMSGIRSRNTKPEILIRSLLHRHGFRFRLHVGTLPGKPDIVLRRHHAVIFVHGCFWHGHGCSQFRWPQTHADFWREKIRQNQVNDQRAKQALLANGWRVGITLECALRGAGKNIEKAAQSLAKWLRGNAQLIEVQE